MHLLRTASLQMLLRRAEKGLKGLQASLVPREGTVDHCSCPEACQYMQVAQDKVRPETLHGPL